MHTQPLGHRPVERQAAGFCEPMRIAGIHAVPSIARRHWLLPSSLRYSRIGPTIVLATLLTALALLEPSGSPETASEPTSSPDATADDTVPEPPQLPEPPTLPEPPVTGPESPESEDVIWDAPESCPGADEVRRGIERRLGRTLAADEVSVTGRVSPTVDGFALELQATVAGTVEARRLEASDCQALADATALVVALAIDPIAVAEVIQQAREVPVDEAPPAPALPPTTVAPSTSTPAPASDTTSRATADAEPSPPARGLEGGILRATAGVGLGATPGVTGAFTFAGGLRWARARLELEGSYWIPRRTNALDGATVAVQLGAAAVRGCGQIRRDRIEAPLCAGLLVGGMRGDGRGVPGARTAQGLWLAAEAGVGLSWWLSPRWALAGGFAAAIPLVQPAFEVGQDPAVRLFEPSPVAGRLWLGAELRLGRTE